MKKYLPHRVGMVPQRIVPFLASLVGKKRVTDKNIG